VTPFVPSWAGLVSLVLSFGLPVVVGLVTKASWTSSLKAMLLLAFQGVAQFLVAWQVADSAHSAFDWRGWLMSVGVGFVMSVAAHFGLWKPTGVSDTAQMMLVNDGHSDDYPPRR
jgi:hypothetical protein